MKLAAALLVALAACQDPPVAPARDQGGPAPARTTDDAGTLAGARADLRPDAGAGATACVDAWLKANKLNEYGDPEGTMYTGGTPLFDEKTGKRTDRVEYVKKKHSGAAKACQ